MLDEKASKFRLVKILIGIGLAYFVIIGIGQHRVSEDESYAWNFSENSFEETITPGRSNFMEVVPEIVAARERGFNAYSISTAIRDEANDTATPNFRLEDYISNDDDTLFDEILQGCPIEGRVDFYSKAKLCVFSPQESWKNFTFKMNGKLEDIQKRNPSAADFIKKNLQIYFNYTTSRDWKPYGGWIAKTEYREARMVHITFNLDGTVISANFEDRKTKKPNFWTSYRVPD